MLLVVMQDLNDSRFSIANPNLETTLAAKTFEIAQILQLSCVFFGCVGPIHYKTCLREAYASLRGVKGSLRGGVLFGVAYAGGYARAILSANLKKSALKQLLLGLLWLHFLVFGLLYLHFLSFWPFVASFLFILAFCAFHKVLGLRC